MMKIVLLFSIIILISISLLVEHLLGLEHFTQHPLLQQILQTSIILLVTWGLLYLVKVSLWPKYEERRKKPVPHLVKDLFDFFIIASSILLIIVGVFEKPIFSLVAAGSLVAAAVTISLQGVIQDAFGAIVIDVDVPYREGDWLKLPNGIEGKVQKISWRHTSLLTNDKTLVHVPNGQLIKEQIINLSQPDPWLMDTYEVNIDHEVPVKRVRRLLEGAVSQLECLHNHTCHAFARQSSEGGITYSIRYMMPEHGIWREVRHQVIEAVTEALHAHNLKISKSLGTYDLAKASNVLQLTSDVTNEQIISMSHLFKEAPDNIIKKAASLAKRLNYPAHTEVISIGEDSASLYVIGEGAISVCFDQRSKSESRVLTFPSFFGERSFYRQTPRNATITAKTDVLLLEFNKEEIKSLLQEYPEGMDILAQTIISRDADLEQYFASQQQTLQEDKEDLLNRVKSEIRHFMKKI